jgi:FdhD protein
MATTAERVGVESLRRQRVEPLVIQEDVLTIDIEEVGAYSLMWTPTCNNAVTIGYCSEDGILTDSHACTAVDGMVPEPFALAAGFAFTEGLVNTLADISNMSVCPERSDMVRMRLRDPKLVAVRRRNVVMNSSCGVCGGREQLQDSAVGWAKVPDTLRVTVANLTSICETLQQEQEVFGYTGGAHGAIIFDASLKVVSVAEDLGRHNALDKVIGQRFLTGQGFVGCGAFITSRISYEMVAKAARAGLELLAAISAPSSLAIEIADRAGITLCGFVRCGSAEIYTHSHRVATEINSILL